MKNLVVVESPAKAKIIAKYLNSNPRLKHLGTFSVMASMGHIRDLPKKSLGVDIEKGFVPEYVVNDDKKKTISELIKKAKESDMVWLASDKDLEGAAIAKHIKDVLKLTNGKYHRITFTEITSKALEEAVLNPGKIDNKMVDAQETRRILDRLVGFKLSPLLWKKYKGIIGLSAGRVQSAVLALIVEKESLIKEFQSTKYWYIEGNFGDLKEIKLYGKDAKVFKSESSEHVVSLLKNVGKQFKVVEAKGRQTSQRADLPYITSTLQQEAYSKLGCTVKRVMAVAQELYENGLITYMRTDSYSISADFAKTCKEYILDTYGSNYLGDDTDKKKTRSAKGAQEAHEAIRPTNVLNKTPEGLTGEHKKLYDMIWCRTVAYFMKPALFDEVDWKITDNARLKEEGLFFLASFKKCKFPGFLTVYGLKPEVLDAKLLNSGYVVKMDQITARNTWTSPPTRFNEASIVKAMEAEGIGRPSTYTSIVQKLYEKQYVLKSDVAGTERNVCHYVLSNHKIKEVCDKINVGSDKSKLVPTDIGVTILEFLNQSFSYVTDKAFTSHMEADIDKVEAGEKTKLAVLSGFWKQFGQDIDKQLKLLKGEKKTELTTASNEVVVNNKTYTVRIGRYGPVIEYNDNGEKKFIGLKAYLKYKKKEYTDIDESDVKMLTSVPQTIGNVNGHPVVLTYGPYGFYAKWNNTNVKLLAKTIHQWMNGQIDMEAVKASIEYSQK